MTDVHDQFIVWQGSDAGLDVEIFYCDVEKDPLTSIQLTQNLTDDRHPQVDNKIIVWDGREQFVAAVSYVDMNDASPSTVQLPTEAALYDRLSDVKDNKVVWVASVGSFYHVFYYDLSDSSPSIVQLPDGSSHNWQPLIDNGQVVWRTENATGGQILAHRLVSSQTHQVADLPYSEISSLISQSDHHAWLFKRVEQKDLRPTGRGR
jgi:hypothetical protein